MRQNYIIVVIIIIIDIKWRFVDKIYPANLFFHGVHITKSLYFISKKEVKITGFKDMRWGIIILKSNTK